MAAKKKSSKKAIFKNPYAKAITERYEAAMKKPGAKKRQAEVEASYAKAVKQQEAHKRALKKAAAKRSSGLAEYGGNKCFFSVGGVTTPSDDFPASRNGWRSAVQLAYKNTSPRGAMFIDMRCSDTPRGGGIPMAQCYWNSELKRASCGLEGSEGPVKNPLDTPYHKAAALREETTLAGLHPRRVKSKR